jgi:acetyl esterase/lipase
MIWTLIASLFMQQPITFEQVAALPSRAPDHTIAYGSAPQQFGHLRLPKGSGPHPVVIFIHGGCYKAEYSIAHAGAFEQAVADLGYAVWSIEYRRVGDPGGGWPGTFQDIAKATDHLKILAKQYPLDLHRVVASGHSAGGNSALWLAGRRRIAKESPLFVEDPLAIKAVLALAPAGDFLEMHARNGCGAIMEPLMGGSPAAAADRYAAANPGQLLPTKVPQVLIIGGRDVSFRSFGRSYVQLARGKGETQLHSIEVPEAGHFDVIAPTTTAWVAVTRELRELMR